jgi:uncharacterized membrane protein (DUF373 family)
MRIPKPLKPIVDAWMAFSRALGKVMSFILLTVVWVVVFGIYGIVLKIIRLFQQEDSSSTWKEPIPEDAKTMKFSF